MKCSHLDSLVNKEDKSEENHYIHREVKCSHLFPEPDSSDSITWCQGLRRNNPNLGEK
jgi:hypothetical protein